MTSTGPADDAALFTQHASFLLGRPLRAIPTDAGAAQLTGATLLVTGAAGSVGRALISSLLRLNPARIIALDHHEASLFHLGQHVGAEAPVELHLVDVRNAAKMRRICADARPTVVVHLAAYKHVPFAEHEPDEPISVNVLGTEVVADAALEAGVRHFVYPSSDKAVNPPSLYGATKRLAETLLLARSHSTESASDRPPHSTPRHSTQPESTPPHSTEPHSTGQVSTSFHVVRYVNILGTSGSVLETFARQARSGGPLSLTDTRMTRYWMAMEEAVALLWHALSLSTGSRTLLDTGPSIPVQIMAERVCELVRGGAAPSFVVTGSRPGERLAEELASASETLATCGEDPVWRVVDARRGEHAALIPGMLDELRALVPSASAEMLRHRTMELSQLLQ